MFFSGNNWLSSSIHYKPKSYTISLNVYRENNQNLSHCCEVLIAKDNELLGLEQSWEIHLSISKESEKGGKLRLHHRDEKSFPGYQEVFYSDESIDLNKWYHISLVFDAEKEKAYFYIDGTLDSLKKYKYAKMDFSSSWVIGAGMADQKFKGRLNNIRMYDRALSAKEIRKIWLVDNK